MYYVVLNCLKTSASHLSCKLCPLGSVKKCFGQTEKFDKKKMAKLKNQFGFYKSEQTPAELTSYINICQEKSTNSCGTTSEIKKIALCTIRT